MVNSLPQYPLLYNILNSTVITSSELKYTKYLYNIMLGKVFKNYF